MSIFKEQNYMKESDPLKTNRIVRHFIWSISKDNAQNLITTMNKCKNLNFIEFNFKQCHLDDDQFENLLQEIFKCEYLNSLTINIEQSFKVYQLKNPQIIQDISKLQNLKFLKLNLFRQLSDDIALIFAQGIGQCQSIIDLSLILDQFHCDRKLKVQIVEQISNIQNLRSLYLQFKYCTFSEQEYAKSISKFKKLKHLCLDLQEQNKLNDDAAAQLGSSISQILLLTSLNLNISWNKINIGAFKLSQEISKLENLKSLTLKLDYNSLGDDGVILLGQGLSKCKDIEELDIDLSNNKFDAKGAIVFIQEIKKLILLKSFSFRATHTKIGEGAQKIGCEISQIKNLKSLNLDLTVVSLSVDGAGLLGKEIGKCTNLNSLNIGLSSNKLGPEGTQKFIQELKNLVDLRVLSLNLQYNQIGQQGMLFLQQGIRKLSIKSLTLNLFENGISQEDFTNFIKEISNLKNLSYMYVKSGCNRLSISNQIKNKLKKCLRLVNFIFNNQ